MITTGPTVTTTGTRTGLNRPCPDVTSAQATEPWSQLKAKRKAPISSIPKQKEPWPAAWKCKQGGKFHFCPHPPMAFQLTKKCSIWDKRDFPPFASHGIPPSSLECNGLCYCAHSPWLCPSSLSLLPWLCTVYPSSSLDLPTGEDTYSMTDPLSWGHGALSYFGAPSARVSSLGPAPPCHCNLAQHSREIHWAPESSTSSSQPTTLILDVSII